MGKIKLLVALFKGNKEGSMMTDITNAVFNSPILSGTIHGICP